MRFRDNVTKDLGFGRGLFFFWGARRSQCVPLILWSSHFVCLVTFSFFGAVEAKWSGDFVL